MFYRNRKNILIVICLSFFLYGFASNSPSKSTEVFEKLYCLLSVNYLDNEDEENSLGVDDSPLAGLEKAVASAVIKAFL